MSIQEIVCEAESFDKIWVCNDKDSDSERAHLVVLIYYLSNKTDRIEKKKRKTMCTTYKCGSFMNMLHLYHLLVYNFVIFYRYAIKLFKMIADTWAQPSHFTIIICIQLFYHQWYNYINIICIYIYIYIYIIWNTLQYLPFILFFLIYKLICIICKYIYFFNEHNWFESSGWIAFLIEGSIQWFSFITKDNS
jgi:hypothetical protein